MNDGEFAASSEATQSTRLLPKRLTMDSKIRVVAFDAVGTLIYAEPTVTVTYCRILNELSGRTVDETHVRRVLGLRLAERSGHDDLRTNEATERQFWYDLIAELVPDADRVDACFSALYDHFGRGSNWRCYDDVAATLAGLKSAGLQLVLASNFDERLNAVCAGLEEMSSISRVIISSEIGWRKPNVVRTRSSLSVTICSTISTEQSKSVWRRRGSIAKDSLWGACLGPMINRRRFLRGRCVR